MADKNNDAASRGLGRLCRFDPQSVQDILDALGEAVLAVDADLRLIAANRAAMELLGVDAGDLIGKDACEVFGPDSCPRDCLARTVLTGEPITGYQAAIDLGSGRSGQVLIRTVPLRSLGSSGAGPVAGTALIMSDVTEVTTLRKQVDRRRFGGMIGDNRRMRELFGLIEDVAPSGASVLIRGETGTGKELVARAIHNAGNRAEGPFVMVNCSALPETLLESELFGHVRGSFTGAVADRRGRFEEASGGTLFLDEIGDVSPAVQVKLLRVLQEKVIERVGDNKPVPVDVRIITATNRDIEALMSEGGIREDFYYRIKVVGLAVPPLRERREDIPLLIGHFLEHHAEAGPLSVGPAAMAALMAHRWPGNVRELENAVEHAVVLARGGVIEPRHLPPEIADAGRRSDGAIRDVPRHSDDEKTVIAAALERAGWNRSRAARRLGIDRTTLWRKIREYGLEPPRD